MPDGPHNNLKLGRRWKRFAAASYNNAADGIERCALAADALVREVLTDDTRALLTDLLDYAQRPQLDLAPVSTVQNIFSKHPKSAFGDTLQGEVEFRLWDKGAPDAAIEEALEASVDDQIRKAKIRMEEECIRARDCGEMRKDQSDCMVTRANVVFDGLPRRAICDALRKGDKDAFKGAASKRDGLEEGPSL